MPHRLSQRLLRLRSFFRLDKCWSALLKLRVGNEIPVSIELLKAFDVAGLAITTDALLTQRKFCQQILDAQADYCLPVKANQKQLYEDIRDIFEPFDETDPPEVEHRRFETLHAEVGAHFETYTHRRRKR